MKAKDSFTKYEEKGAYHWAGTYGRHWLYHRPTYHARYGIPVRLLSERLPLRRTRGVDIGCGDGVLLYKLCRHGGRAIGLDQEQAGLDLAAAELEKRGVGEQVELVQGSCYDMPFGDASLDYATATELIEHLDDVPGLLREVHRVLKPGGWFICTTPLRRADQAAHEVRDPFHVREYVASELHEELAGTFGKSVEVRGAYPAWLSRWLYKKDGVFPWLDQAVRVSFRVLSLAWNPYLYALPRNPGPECHTLVGIAQKERGAA